MSDGLNAAATLSLAIDTQGAEQKLFKLREEYLLLKEALGSPVAASGVSKVTDEIKKLETAQTSLKKQNEDLRAQVMLLTDRMKTFANEVKSNMVKISGDVSGVTRNVAKDLSTMGASFAAATDAIIADKQKLATLGVDFASVARGQALLAQGREADSKAIRGNITALEAYVKKLEAAQALLKATDAPSLVQRKFGPDISGELAKLTQYQEKLAAIKGLQGSIDIAQYLNETEAAERVSNDRRLKSALDLVTKKQGLESSYTAWWASELAKRDAIKVKEIESIAASMLAEEKIELASYEKRRAAAIASINAKQNAEKSYTSWWVTELNKREAAEAKDIADIAASMSAREAIERASYDQRLRMALAAIKARQNAEESYTAWWASELKKREAAEAKEIADVVARMNAEEALERESYAKRKAAALNQIAARKQAESAYTDWWAAELKKRDAMLLISSAVVNPVQRTLPVRPLAPSESGGSGPFAGLMNTTRLPGTTAAEAAAALRTADALNNLANQTQNVSNAVGQATQRQSRWNSVNNESHALARGLSGSLGQLWMTYGQLTPLLTGAALGAGFISATKRGSEFEYQLTFVKALGGESADAVDRLSASALKLGATSLKGPVELANGLRILAQAGLNAEQAIAALPKALDLAIVGEMEMEQAATTLVGVMNAFGLSIADVGRVGDVFAKAAALSQTSVSGMTNAMRTASVVGEQYKVSMEDSAAALTLLAKVNITGTSAGTALRNMLKELYAPTKQSADVMQVLGLKTADASGKLRPMADIIYDLKERLGQFDQASQVNILQKLFGERGAKEAISMLALTREQWDKLRDSIADSAGFMSEVASELEMSTKGIFLQAKNSLEAGLIKAFDDTEGGARKLAIALRDLFASSGFQAGLSTLVDGMTALARVAVQLTPALLGLGVAWAALKAIGLISFGVTAASAALTTFSTTLTIVSNTARIAGGGFTGLVAGLTAAGSSAAAAAGAGGLGALLGVIGKMLGPIGLLVAGLGATYAAYRYLSAETPASVTAANTFTSSVERQAARLKEANAELEKKIRLQKSGSEVEVGAAQKVLSRLRRERIDLEHERDNGPVGLAGAIANPRAALRALKLPGLIDQSKRAEQEALDALDKAKRLQSENDSLSLESYVLESRDAIRKIKDDASASGKTVNTTVADAFINVIEKGGLSRANLLKYKDQFQRVLDDLRQSLIGSGNKIFEMPDGKGKSGKTPFDATIANATQAISVIEGTYQTIDAQSRIAQAAGLKTASEAMRDRIDLIKASRNEEMVILRDAYVEIANNTKLSADAKLKAEETIQTKMLELVRNKGKEITDLSVQIEVERQTAIASARANARRILERDLPKLSSKIEAEQIAQFDKRNDPLLSDRDRLANDASISVTQRYSEQLGVLEESLNTLKNATNICTNEQIELEDQIAKVREKMEGQAKSAAELAVKLYDHQNSFAFGLQSGVAAYENSVSSMAKTVSTVVSNAFKGMEDALVNFVMTGKGSFKSLANSIIADMVRISMQQMVTKPLANAFGSWLASSFGGGGGYVDPGPLMPSANGNAFASADLSRYSSTIVSQPTTFAFANGGVPRRGLMGEAGAEAIMPLTRINGKLGVRAESSQSVNVTINAPVDARGASADVVPMIAAAMAQVEQRIYKNVPGVVRQAQIRNRVSPTI